MQKKISVLSTSRTLVCKLSLRSLNVGGLLLLKLRPKLDPCWRPSWLKLGSKLASCWISLGA